jgi:hypothetical protein
MPTKRRIERLEQFWQNQQPATLKGDGIEAHIYYGKHSTVPGIVVRYDSLRFMPGDAVKAIGPRLPPDGNIFAFPFPLSLEQWTLKYGPASETLH